MRCCVSIELFYYRFVLIYTSFMNRPVPFASPTPPPHPPRIFSLFTKKRYSPWLTSPLGSQLLVSFFLVLLYPVSFTPRNLAFLSLSVSPSPAPRPSLACPRLFPCLPTIFLYAFSLSCPPPLPLPNPLSYRVLAFPLCLSSSSPLKE